MPDRKCLLNWIERYMKVWHLWLFLAASVVVSGCSADADTKGIYIFTQSYDLTSSDNGWTGAFADYPIGDSSAYELKATYTHQPDGTPALLLSAKKHRSEIFMFAKKKVTGLSPNADYTVTFNVEFAYTALEGADSVDAGEYVFVKAGAIGIEPKSVISGKQYVMNLDKGDKQESGRDMVYIGNASPASKNSYGFNTAIRTNSSTNEKPITATTNNEGELWLVVGTESDFAGRTLIYYTKIDVVLSAPK